MQYKNIFLFIILMISVWAQLENDVEQAVLVITDDWESSTATLYLAEKQNGKWDIMAENNSWPVVIGRTGLAWGRGEFTLPTSDFSVKKEGDGKAPAGIFKISPQLYGYDKNPPEGNKLPYTQVTSEWLGIDDPKSKYYNQIIHTKDVPQKDWDSYEDMKRKDELYRWVLVVEHNTTDTKPGSGSCIFIHIWRSPEKPTAGCTAMEPENILRLIKWLDPQKKPHIIQLPKSIYQAYHQKLNMPMLPSSDKIDK